MNRSVHEIPVLIVSASSAGFGAYAQTRQSFSLLAYISVNIDEGSDQNLDLAITKSSVLGLRLRLLTYPSVFKVVPDSSAYVQKVTIF